MIRLMLILALLTAGAFSAPADASGQFPFPTRPDVERDDRRDREERRDRDRDDDRDDERWEIGDDDERGRDRSARGEERGPPFCRNGEGHPVHGRQWCRDRGFDTRSAGDIIFGDSRVDRERDRDRYRGASYETEHAEFHRALDAHYYELAARRPLDVGYQIELRREKQAEHDRWHRRAGVAHR